MGSTSAKRITVQDLIGKIGRVIVNADVFANGVAEVIPFHAGHLAGLAADALGDVDQFGHFQGGRGRWGRVWWWRNVF